MSGIEKLQFDHEQILLDWKIGSYENVVNIAKVSWENSKPS